MHALTQVVHLPSLDSVIDFSPLTVTPDTSLLDVVTQMSRQQASSVLVVENLTTDGLQVVGWFTQQDAIALLSRGFDFRTAKVSQVMVTPVITLNYFEVKSITFILFTLRKYKLPMLPIVAERGQLIGIVTLDTIYQALQILPCSSVEGETVGVAVLKDKQQPKLSSNVNCTEERLRLLESAVVNANDAIVIAAADALDEPLGPQIIYVNEAFTRMSGWSATEVIGKTPRILQGELTDRIQLDRIRAALQDGLPIRAELINYHKNGSTYWVEVNIVPIADRKGKLTHFVSVQRDITKRKLTEEALRASEALLREVTENIRQVLFVRDIKQNKIVYVTPAYEDIWGRSCASLYENSLDFLEAIHPLDRDRVIAGMKSQAAGKNYNEEYRIVRPDGEVRWICTRAFPLQNELGEVYRVVGISEDISELKQAQAALKQANAELEKRVEERTQALQQINRQLRHEISDRKQAEAALRQTQQQLQAILDNCPAIVYVVDTQNRFLLINRQYEKVFHCTKQQITGKSIYVFFNSEFADIFAVNNQNVLTSGKSVEAEEIAPQEDGLHTYFSVKFALKDANGVPYAICGISTDITDRKHANESLVRFRTAIESSSDAIGMADIGGEVIYVNPAFVELFEYTLAELQVAGGPPVLYINKAECKEIFATVENGQSWRGEVKMQTKRGQILDIDLRADAIKDATGKIIGTVGIHTDITERKRVEERLRLRDRAIAASSNGIVISDARLPNLPIIYANPAFEYITGYSLEEVIGRNCRFLQGADTNQPEIKELSIAIRQARNCTVILRNYRKDGSLFWNELSVSPVFDTDGNCTHYVGIQNDITERMQAEEELRTALEKEKELNELKSRVVTMISHEFRTPLSTILSSSELLEHYRHKWAEEKQLSHVHRIQVAVKHMTNMLNDVLVIGKAEVGKLDFKPVPLDLVEYCRYLVEELQFDINTQDAIAFSCEYESIPCCMDEKLLGYILRNLLSNAIKYSPNGSTVKFSLTCREERAILEIQDQGIGIPQEDLPYLFESFHRATNVGNIQGTGLGLTIVKKCTDLHQGEIFVTSEVGIGTKFTVALPLKNG